jgi:hypothetical protein
MVRIWNSLGGQGAVIIIGAPVLAISGSDSGDVCVASAEGC